MGALVVGLTLIMAALEVLVGEEDAVLGGVVVAPATSIALLGGLTAKMVAAGLIGIGLAPRDFLKTPRRGVKMPFRRS